MNKFVILEALFGVAALLMLPLAHAATFTQSDYDAGETGIDANYKSQAAACEVQAGNAKDVCMEQAKAAEKVARAELEYRYTGLPSDQNKVLVAKADSTFAVAKEECDDKAGNDKDVCVKRAEATQTRALADAQVAAARANAIAEKRAADYTVAAEKCDALSGDAQASCLAMAKADFGKDMTKADYNAAGAASITKRYDAAAETCDSLAGNTKDVCVEEAKANEKVARAELQYEFSGTASDGNEVLVTKADTAYSVAKEKCDDKAGNAADVCIKQAEANHTKALADAKVGEIKTDAIGDKLDADYNLATEKCDVLSGDAKASCIAAAKAKFAKT